MCSALYRGAQSLGSYRCKNEGGKNIQNGGRIWFVRAVFRGVSFKIHWRLSLFQSCPRPLLTQPLRTTFVHILRLNCLLSTTKLQMIILRWERSKKALQIVAN